jgi:hypothetical protein
MYYYISIFLERASARGIYSLLSKDLLRRKRRKKIQMTLNIDYMDLDNIEIVAEDIDSESEILSNQNLLV